jgi:hypothetical protein
LSGRTCVGRAEKCEHFLESYVETLELCQILVSVTILKIFEALDIVPQTGVHCLLLDELELELLNAMLHFAVESALWGDLVFFADCGGLFMLAI